MFQNPEVAFGGAVPMLGLIENIYAAAQTPALWDGVMQEILRVSQGESVALYAGAPDARSPALVSMQGEALDAWGPFAEYYAAINPIYPACQKMFRPDESWYSEQALPDAVFEKTEFYNDFYMPNKMHYSLGMLIELGDAPAASISIQRQKAIGPFPGAAEVMCQTLRPHLQRALMIYHQLGLMQTAVLGLETALEAHGQAVMGVDALGQVVVCNPLATAMVQAGDGVRLVQGRLVCSRSEDSRALQGMLAGVMAGGVGGAMLVHRRDKTALRMTVSAFRASLPGSSSPIAALVYLSDPSQTAPSRASVMRELYGLTPTEGRVADLLLEGLEVRELAGRSRITLETARFHVKRVLAKTGARKQSELMRLMLGLPSLP